MSPDKGELLARLRALVLAEQDGPLLCAVRAAAAAGIGPGELIALLTAEGFVLDRMEVCRVADLRPGTVRGVQAFGRRVAILNDRGTIRAVDATCPHANGPLDRGSLQDGVLTCPVHGFDFNTATGACLTDPRERIACFEVETEEGRVWLRRPRG